MSTAFDAAHSDHLFAALSSARGVLVAVSGGPDSVALLRLAAAWARRHGVPVYAATVDHGLRAASRAEAEQVGLWAAGLGLPHAILTWVGEKPKSRIQERARAARYDLLVAHARAVGADHLLTAHHADDQAETILLRLSRGSGLAGLAGMQEATLLGGVTQMRPFLSLRKAELVAYCEAARQPFFRDPSNQDPLFARARWRRIAPLLAQQGLDVANLLRLARRAARADAALQQVTLALRAKLAAQRADGHFSADICCCRDVPDEILLRLLELEVAALDAGKPVRLGRLEALTSALAAALRSGQNLRATLAGTLVVLDQHGILTLRREGLRRRGLRETADRPSPHQSAPARPSRRLESGALRNRADPPASGTDRP